MASPTSPHSIQNHFNSIALQWCKRITFNNSDFYSLDESSQSPILFYFTDMLDTTVSESWKAFKISHSSPWVEFLVLLEHETKNDPIFTSNSIQSPIPLRSSPLLFSIFTLAKFQIHTDSRSNKSSQYLSHQLLKYVLHYGKSFFLERNIRTNA